MVDGSLKFDTSLNKDGFEKGVKELSASAEKGTDIIKGIMSKIAISAGAIGTAVVGAGFKFNSEMEQYQAGFETMLGSATKADQMLGQLKNFAAKTPFELSDLASASQTLLAFGTNADDIMPTLKMLGDVSLGNKDKFQGLTLAFAQMSSTGHLMGQDLLQMINAGFNPLQVMSEKTGRSMADLKSDMEKGAISSEMVTQAFKDATSAGGRFYNAMDKQSTTMAGQWSTIKDNFSQFSGKILKPLTDYLTNTVMPAVNKLLEKLTEKFDTMNWTKMKDILYAISAVLIPLTSGFIAFKVAVGVQSVIESTATAFKVLNKVMNDNPIFLIVTLVATLVSAIIYLWTTNEGFRNFITNMWTGIVDFFTKTIPNALQTFVSFLSNGLENIKQFFIDAWNNILNFFTVTVPQKISEGVNTIITFFEKIPYYIGYMIGYIIGLFVSFFQNLWNFATVDIPNFIEKVIEWFENLPEKIAEFMLNAWQKIKDFGDNLWNFVTVDIPNFINGIINWFAQLPGRIWDWLVNAYNNFSNWISNLKSRASTGIWDLINSIISWFEELPGNMLDIGKNIVEGLWNGIKNAGNWIKQKIKDFAKGILDGMKSALDIHSPSKLFEKEVGRYVGLGVGVGIDDSLKTVFTNMKNTIDTETSKLSANVATSSTYTVNSNGISDAINKIGNRDIIVKSNLYMDSEKVANATNKVNKKLDLQYGF